MHSEKASQQAPQKRKDAREMSGFADFRVQQNQIGACMVALGVFAAYRSFEQLAQLVFGAQLVVPSTFASLHRRNS